jgi:hypothetical protein
VKYYTVLSHKYNFYTSSLPLDHGFNFHVSNCNVVSKLLLKLFSLFFPQIPGNVEYHVKYMLYSKKQHLFLVVYEFGSATNEVVLYWENNDSLTANSKYSTVKGLPVFETPFFLLLFLKIILIFLLCNQ